MHKSKTESKVVLTFVKKKQFKGSRMGPFSGDFQTGGDSERNIPFFSALYRLYTACIIARLLYGSQQYWTNEMRSTVRYDRVIDVLFTLTFYKTHK